MTREQIRQLIGLIVASLSIIGGAFWFGTYYKEAEFNMQLVDYKINESSLKIKISILEKENKDLKDQLNKFLQPQKLIPASQNTILTEGKLTDGLDMGADTSEKKRDWVKSTDDAIRMDYPGGQTWGAVFITVGKPAALGSLSRKSRDYSAYSKLIVEMKGKNGATVEIGIKGINDPDDGSEKKVAFKLTDNWNKYEIDLKRLMFSNNKPNMKQLYVVTEFVFPENSPQTLYVKNIAFE
jgi:hypothetical protein